MTGVTSGWIPDLIRTTMHSTSDHRGTITEFHRASADCELFPAGVSQINVTRNRRGTVRGLHGEAMAKIVTVVSGEAFGFYADCREHSPTFGAVCSTLLRPGTRIRIPEGVCNGFQAVSTEDLHYLYGFSVEWSQEMPALSFTPYDPGLGLTFPVPLEEALISDRDRDAGRFSDFVARDRAARGAEQ